MTQLILTTYSEDGEKTYPFLYSSLEDARKDFKRARDSHRRKYFKYRKQIDEWRQKTGEEKKKNIPSMVISYFDFCGISISFVDKVEFFELQDWFDKRVKN